MSRAAGQKVDITCKALAGNQIDWNCVFGPGALEEVSERGGFLTTCPSASKVQPCSRCVLSVSLSPLSCYHLHATQRSVYVQVPAHCTRTCNAV